MVKCCGSVVCLVVLYRTHGGTTFAEFHGTKGPLTVENVPWTTRLSHPFLEAGQELGYPVLDVNTAIQTGFMVPHGFLRRGSRCSNAKAFLQPASRRRNLHVALNTFVKKVLLVVWCKPPNIHSVNVNC